MERVIFWPEREANPFFHLLESMWMLAGRNDVPFLSDLVSRLAMFSDDGVTFNGAYGFRWRKHFQIDQLKAIAAALKENKYCRRQVLSMWDAPTDLGSSSLDIPCNTHAYFSCSTDNKLDMTVCNRSNDIVWGALGANVVHFSILQEFLALLIGCEVGRYWQVSNNMHLYLEQHHALMETMSVKAFPSDQYRSSCPYARNLVRPYPLGIRGEVNSWLGELEMFLEVGLPLGMRNNYLQRVVAPMAEAYSHYKEANGTLNKLQQAKESITACCASDWMVAGREWISRREEKVRLKLKG